MAESSPNPRIAQLWRIIDRFSSIATLVASLAIVVALGSLFLFDRPSAAETIAGAPPDVIREDPAVPRVARLGSTVKGQPSARLAIIEFSDFECPFCARYATGTHERIEAEYVDTGKIQYGFRNMPLDMIHPNAQRAAEAAECASRQGRFWQMYNTLFTNQGSLGPSELLRHGQTAGLDHRDFKACLEGQAVAKVAEDRAEARRLAITSTPTFLLGELQPGGQVRILRSIKGAHTFDVFRDALDQLEKDLMARR